MRKKLTQEEKDARRAKRNATMEARGIEVMKHHLKTRIENDKINCSREGNRAGTPTRYFEPGQKVIIGSIDECTINEKVEEGVAYVVNCKSDKKEDVRVFPWYEIYECVDVTQYPEIIHKEKKYWINFRQTCIMELIRTSNYNFGINADPSYQRDLVWEERDKVALIDSIFKDIEIGKFVLIHMGYAIDDMFEILDGKQRLNALCEFFEGRFRYQGLLFCEMHPRDRSHFRNYPISVGETRDIISEREKFEYFLRLNTRGRDQTAGHIAKVEAMLAEAKAIEDDTIIKGDK